jgi:hypothetical protein
MHIVNINYSMKLMLMEDFAPKNPFSRRQILKLHSRLSAVEADGCQVSRPLRGLHDFIPTACVRSMRTWGGAWHVDLGVGEERRPRTAWQGPGRSMTAC